MATSLLAAEYVVLLNLSEVGNAAWRSFALSYDLITVSSDSSTIA